MVGGRGGGAGRRQERQALMVAFAVALLMGTAVYFRIWARQSSDPSFTADDREELRFAPQILSAFLVLSVGEF
nr:unnamed protein product [Digitaria exilis]